MGRPPITFGLPRFTETASRTPHGRSASAIRASWGRKIDDASRVKAIELAVAALVRASCFVREVSAARSTLEDVFAELTGAAPRRGDASAEGEGEGDVESEDEGEDEDAEAEA